MLKRMTNLTGRLILKQTARWALVTSILLIGGGGNNQAWERGDLPRHAFKDGEKKEAVHDSLEYRRGKPVRKSKKI